MKRIGCCLLLLAPLALASCGANRNLGEYSFQMGKPSGAHITTSITLRSNEVVRSDKPFGKSMTFYLQANLGNKSEESDQSAESLLSEESIQSEVSVDPSSEPALSSVDSSASVASSSSKEPKNLEDTIYELLAEGLTLDGYYTIVNVPDKEFDQLRIGFFLDDLSEITGETIELEPEVIEMIVYSEITPKNITLKIPVSIPDVMYQLYWYGFDLYNFTEVEAHDRNTHPTKEDIDKINETYPSTHGGSVYRDYYTLSLGLSKK